MVSPHSQNTVGVCNQITLLKVTDAPIQVPNIFDLTVSFKFLKFNFQICLLFVPEMSNSFTSYIVQIIYIALAWILPASFDLKNLNILHQTMVYAASFCADQDSL